MTPTGRIRLKILSYLCAARPLGQDAKTLSEGLIYDGFPTLKEEATRQHLDLMQCDELAKGKMDPLSKDRLLWYVTDKGIETALQNGVA